MEGLIYQFDEPQTIIHLGDRMLTTVVNANHIYSALTNYPS